MTKKLAASMAWLLAVALVPAGPVAAEDAEDDDRTLGFIEGGVLIDLDREPADSAKFEEYREVPNGLVLDRVFVDWYDPSNSFFVAFDGTDLVQDDQQLELAFGKLDLWKVAFDWSENPRRYGDGARTLWTHQGDGVFTLDPALIDAVSSAPGSDDADEDGVWDDGTQGAILRDAVAFGSRAVDPGFQRRTGEVTTLFTPTDRVRFGFTGERERRSGNMPQTLGGYFSRSPHELAAPVDYETDTLNLFFGYSHPRWNVDLRYTASDFDTTYKSVTWDDPRFAEDLEGDSSRGRLYLSSDNEMHRWSVQVGGNIPAGNTRINFSASQTRTTQDDPFLPKTINSMIVATPIGLSNLDGEHETTLYDLRFNSHPSSWFSIKGWWRQYEFDDQSPVITVDDYVEVDRSLVEDPRRNLPYRYETTKFGIAPSFRPADWATVALSYEHAETDRRHAAVLDTDEDTWKLTADFLVTDWVSIRTKYSESERTSHHFDAEWHVESFPGGEGLLFPENEAHREFFWADRDREELSLTAEFTPSSKVALYAEALYARDRYSDPNSGLAVGSPLVVQEDRDMDGVAEDIELLVAGRERDKQTSYTIGVVGTPNDHFRIWVDHTWEEIEWSMASRYRGVSGGVGGDDPLDNWFTDVEDEYRTFHLGMDANWNGGNWQARLDVTVSDGRGDILTDIVEGGNSRGDDALRAFPQLKTDFTLLKLDVMRNFPGGWSVGFVYWLEEWDAEDWQTDILAPYVGNPDQDSGSSTSLYLGTDFADYDNDIVMVTARYRF